MERLLPLEWISWSLQESTLTKKVSLVFIVSFWIQVIQCAK